MTHIHHSILATALGVAVVSIPFSCGGSAEVETSAGSGAHGGGGATTTSTTTSANDAANAGAGGSIDETLCFTVCNTMTECGGDVAACIEGCEVRSAAPCGGLYTEWISCAVTENSSLCGSVPAINCNLDDYLACTGELVNEDACTSDASGCSCTGLVDPGFGVEQRCDLQGCECLEMGNVVGTCLDGDATCSVSRGCCVGFFFGY